MPELELSAGSRVTRVVVECGLIGRLCDELHHSGAPIPAGSYSLITDHNVGGLYAERVIGSFHKGGCEILEFRVPAGEGAKSNTTLAEIYEWLASNGVGRDGILVALGGGVVSDLAGFAAATWMRGIPHAICATTIEGAIDAAVGGKTAVNLPAGKNLVGAFHTPVFVGVDPTTFATLPRRDVAAGIAESIKHALITDEAFLEWHEAHADAILARDVDVLTEFAVRDIKIKGDVVAKDPFERTGARMALNFGHTVGHAIESCGAYELRHGECVGLGMLAACRLSEIVGLTDEALTERVRAALSRFELPTTLPTSLDPDSLLAFMRRDKKTRAGRVRFVLLEGIGKVVIDDDITDEQIRDALTPLNA